MYYSMKQKKFKFKKKYLERKKLEKWAHLF